MWVREATGHPFSTCHKGKAAFCMLGRLRQRGGHCLTRRQVGGVSSCRIAKIAW